MKTVQDLILILSNRDLYGISLGDVDWKAGSNEDIQHLIALLEHHKTLKNVSFSWLDLSSSDFTLLKPILIAVKNNPNIQEFHFSHSKLENAIDNNLEDIFNCIKDKNDITFCRNSIARSDVAGDFICMLLRDSNIKRFDFQLNDIGEGSLVMKSIFEAVAQSKLDYLSMAINFIGGRRSCEKELKNLFQAQIKEINLSGNPLGIGTLSEDWVDLFNEINNNKHTESLILYCCELNALIGDEPNEFSEGLIEFVKTTRLKELELSRNDFPKEFTRALIKAASKNPSLTFKCEDNGLSKTEIQSLQLETAQENLKTSADSSQPGQLKTNGHSDSLIFTKNNQANGNGHSKAEASIKDEKPQSNGCNIQ